MAGIRSYMIKPIWLLPSCFTHWILHQSQSVDILTTIPGDMTLCVNQSKDDTSCHMVELVATVLFW